ncbi:MAG: penicillin-binding protein 2 [Candidatus Paceibacterota bacterium]|jgi:cell division protein FtsI (penicillin-binding protein 3)/stage V sporulation protein D (sporulation-specific penicillin-binding protein)
MTGRIHYISIFLIFLALLMVVRLYFVQVVNGEKFIVTAERKNINKNTISYDRGEIYFESKDGETIPAAISRSGFTIAIKPNIIKDPEDIYNTLSKVLVLDKTDFIAKASKKEDPYEEIANHLNTETADKVKALNIYGVTIATDKWRFYPGGRLAANTIGFVGFSGDELAGRYGLERYYEDILKKDPSKAYNNFFAEFFSTVRESLNKYPQEEGNIITSIEPSTELFLENELQNVREKWGSDEAGGIIINPMNGEIIAMAWNPSFDLNNFKESGVKFFNNPLVEGRYEMGSIIKSLTMASGIDLGVVTSSSTYYDAGFLVLDKKRISNYDGKGRGTVNMQEVLNQSLNTGAAYVAMKMGNQKFAEYMRNFGVGTETGIDLPNEGIGLVNNLDSTRDIEIVTASYGQGVAFTPIATVRALSALANGGSLITPHIVKKIEYQSGLTKKISFAPDKQVIKKETSEEISRMLVGVVDKALRGGTAKIPGYSVAAKTGTAQMTNEGTAGYVDGKYLHSFFGYFPAYNPKFLVFLFHTYPKNVRYASETLTDPFLNITKFLINYYQIPPDRPEDVIPQNP